MENVFPLSEIISEKKVCLVVVSAIGVSINGGKRNKTLLDFIRM